MKKAMTVVAFALLLSGAMSAQIILGVAGDLHMDQTMSLSDISNQFQGGQNIFYGPFAEIAFNKLDFGLGGTFSYYPDMWTGLQFMDYDVYMYLGYHIFGARAFLDPFVEMGGGYIASDYASSSEKPVELGDNPVAASMYAYAAAGLGINLGPIGAFTKFAYNMALPQALGTYSDGTAIPPYTHYDAAGNATPNMFKYRVSLGAKLIL